jgi:hypothetical protein
MQQFEWTMLVEDLSEEGKQLALASEIQQSIIFYNFQGIQQ